MNLISRVKSFIIHYRTRCSCVSRLRTREMFMHSPRNPTPSPTYELSFPLGGDLLKLFMFDTRFFTRDASLSLYMYIYIYFLWSSTSKTIVELLHANLHHSFIFRRFYHSVSLVTPPLFPLSFWRKKSRACRWFFRREGWSFVCWFNSARSIREKRFHGCVEAYTRPSQMWEKSGRYVGTIVASTSSLRWFHIYSWKV